MGLAPNANALAAAASGLKALEGSAHLHAFPAFIRPINKDLLEPKNLSSTIHSPFDPSISATTRHSNLGNYPVPVPGALRGKLAHESNGVSLGSSIASLQADHIWNKASALADTKMELGFECQGYRLEECGDWPDSDHNLPQVMALGEDCLFKRVINARRIQEMHWAYKVSRVINAEVQPDTYEVAEKVISYLKENSDPLLYDCFSGQHINFNIQVAPHWDGKNSNPIDSVFAYGQDNSAGHWNFGLLGVSFCADPGYSLHACFKFLDHSVATILPIVDSKKLPLQISMALYSHANVYASTARVSGARSGGFGRAQYIDASMMLPFPPAQFLVPTCRKLLEEKNTGGGTRHVSILLPIKLLKVMYLAYEYSDI
ncbi:uncharacterized protein MELLADRAFT_65209 [Melampsora larici-populina 98AG31]|uniref:Uncharacterized protein n=1 Tax=Melampsora larici-populina (strain 98AG31 / pathotype 3-4-7) TaxID=747676 RepID=F4RUE0_MELLP|nr:uncharacterized protein MELLADRAFT_65209 [Melampsora larici-populina 98AG31]EGG04013.1 hypothetical protein MELLADRAFT_65209 [Melampsora larici-populina 98AG31]